MVGPDTVLTAAHVVYDEEHDRYYQNVKVMPAATWDGSGFVAPYGVAVATETKALPRYIAGDYRADVGVIHLNTPLGEKTGYLNLCDKVNLQVGQHLKTIGFPGDKYGMYSAEGKVLSTDNNEYVKYDLDTMPGQSGSVVLNDNNEVVAVHYAGMNYEASNIGAPVSQRVRDLMKQVKETTGAVYRVYNPNSGLHHYTSSLGEKNYLVKVGWVDEGIAWEAGSSEAVYRLYNPNSGLHFFTANVGEKNYLVKAGWKDEGIAFYGGNNINVYRLYNVKTGEHFYTANYLEKDALVSRGWQYEGVAFQTK